MPGSAESPLRGVVPGPVERDGGSVGRDERSAALRRGAEGRRPANIRAVRPERSNLSGFVEPAPRSARQQVQRKRERRPRAVPGPQHGDGSASGTDERTSVGALREGALSMGDGLEGEVSLPNDGGAAGAVTRTAHGVGPARTRKQDHVAAAGAMRITVVS